MSDSGSGTRMVKVCRVCGYPNPPDEEFCQRDDMDLSTVPVTPMNDSASTSSAAGEESRQARTEEEQEADGTRCPDCGTEGTFRNGRCSACDPAAFSLAWLDGRIENITITSEKPVFIGRVPPADMSLVQQIESFYPTVSRMHAELYLGEQGHLYLRDLGSRNGSTVNNRLIQQFVPEQLNAGDEVAFSGALHARIEQM